MKSKIKIKFVCPHCGSDRLSEVLVEKGDMLFNEMNNIEKKQKYKDDIAYFCWSCYGVDEPKLVDFNLSEGGNA